MSQELLNHITRLTRAIEALAERVTKLEQPEVEDDQAKLPHEGISLIKRGPGRPRKEATPHGT